MNHDKHPCSYMHHHVYADYPKAGISCPACGYPQSKAEPESDEVPDIFSKACSKVFSSIMLFIRTHIIHVHQEHTAISALGYAHTYCLLCGKCLKRFDLDSGTRVRGCRRNHNDRPAQHKSNA